MKRSILLFIIIIGLLISACSNQVTGESTIFIQAPEDYQSGSRAIYGTLGEIDPSSLSQDNFRFEIIVKHKQNRVAYALLKSGEEAALTVPAGINLNFYVGVYYAENSTTNDELFNVYLAADSRQNVFFMPGESRSFELTIDLSRRPRVNTNYGTNMGSTGIAAITGAYLDSGNKPYFSAFPLVTGGSPDSKIIRYLVTDLTPDDASLSVNLSYTGRGNLFDVGVGNRYWFTSANGIQWGNTGSWFNSSGLTTTAVNHLLPYITHTEAIPIDAVMMTGSNEYYYFLSYGHGYVGIADTYESSWTAAVNVDFSSYAFFYPGEDFLLDAEYYSNYRALVATKLGLYLVDNVTLRKYNFNDRLGALEGSKRLIKIPDPANPNLPLLVKKVKVGASYIYLGTVNGLYRINKSSSSWTGFVAGSGHAQLPLDAIDQLGSFDFGPVTTLDYFSTAYGNIVAVSTPKGVWFRNMGTGKSDFISVWDGLPFVPYKAFINSLPYNVKNYFPHETAPIKVVIWDGTNNKFWIGTDFGLASIYYSRLDL